MMNKKVLISGAGFAGLTLAYWLHRFGFQVTVIELGKGLRKGGSPIDVRGNALEVVKEMGIYDIIKSREFVHTDQIVNAADKTLATFSINAQAEYLGDIEIHRGDLIGILYGIVKDDIEVIFDNNIKQLVQSGNNIEVCFEQGGCRNFDLVFGADGTHSVVRQLVFGPEENFKKFFGVYFAFAAAGHIQTGRPKDTGVIYRELGRQAIIYPFKDEVNAVLLFRAPELDWDYRNQQQHKQILREYFGGNMNWKIPEILEVMLHSESLYFDEASQIHMPTWTKGRVALVGDAAYAPSFFTGMGTSLALQGAMILAKALHENEQHDVAFKTYNESFSSFVKGIQARITRGLKVQLPETQQELESSIARWNSK